MSQVKAQPEKQFCNSCVSFVFGDRWLRLRLNMMPLTAGLLELLGESVPLGIYASWSAYTLLGLDPYLWFIGHWTVWMILDYIQLRGIQVSHPLTRSFVRSFILSFVYSFIISSIQLLLILRYFH